MQPNNRAHDVEPEMPSAERKAVLASAVRNAFELLDVVTASTVVRILRKDCRRALFGCVEIMVALLQFAGEPVITRSTANRKGRSHGL